MLFRATDNFTARMRVLHTYQAFVAPDVLLDGRLALFHESEKWLAIADLHFGYEISQRAAGHLVPMWGMATARERLINLIDDYNPQRLVIIGDLVHDATPRAELRDFVRELDARCETVLIAGNHDRELAASVNLVSSWTTGEFYFHHGHCAAAADHRIQVIGHHHPAAVIRDGAGLRLKCPAFVQQERCWILPAFSPWSAGSPWPRDEQTGVWVCTPQRVLCLPSAESLTA